MSLLEKSEEQQMKKDIAHVHAGDTVRVHVKIREGENERIQVFEGIVMGRRRAQNHSTFTVRKISFGHGVERIFPLHSPVIDKIERVRAGQVRRAKLGYLRSRRGKAARIREARTERE